MLHVCNSILTSVVTISSSALDSVSLCVDVLRGNRTTTESAVITETPLAPKLKVVSGAYSGVLNGTRRCGLTNRAPSVQRGRLWAPCCSIFTHIYVSFQACFLLRKKTAPLVSNERQFQLLPVCVLQNKIVINAFAAC